MIGERIRKIIVENGMQIADMASAVSVCELELAAMEQGKRAINPEFNFCDFFEMSIEELVMGL